MNHVPSKCHYTPQILSFLESTDGFRAGSYHLGFLQRDPDIALIPMMFYIYVHIYTYMHMYIYAYIVCVFVGGQQESTGRVQEMGLHFLIFTMLSQGQLPAKGQKYSFSWASQVVVKYPEGYFW